MTDSLSLNEQASDWVVRLNSDQCTRADLTAFDAWLALSEEHRRAYADHASLWAGMGLLAENAEVSALLLPDSVRQSRRPASRRVLLFGGVGAAAAAAVAALVAAPALAVQRYRTQPGEQRRLTLADGSSVLLNTDSVLRVSLGRSERRLYLDQGQAYFKVAKDRRRPFRVFVGDDEVRALGTAFDVSKVGSGARVTLEEGRVAIFNAAGSTRPVATLKPGQQALLAPVAAPQVQTVDLRKSQAWRVGRLVLEDSSLAEATAELNRYGAPRIVLSDASLGALRVSGVFHTGESGAFVESLVTAYPVKVLRQDADEIVLARRPS
jgi:transmembrane sensor